MVLPFARGRSRANDAPPTWVFAVLLIVPRRKRASHAPLAGNMQSAGDAAGGRLCTFNEPHGLHISARYN